MSREIMIRRSFLFPGLVLFWGVFFFSAGLGHGKDDKPAPQFKYVGGTETVPARCEGNLEINPETMTFRCEDGSIDIPYSAVTLMQYRSDVPKKIRKMKVNWKLSPPVAFPLFPSNKKNRYFTVVYRIERARHVMILEVEPHAMRPYLAELDLRTDQRVKVQSYEDY